MHDRDTLHRFLFERYPIRGHLVHLDAAWRALIEHRAYPDAIRETLGRSRRGFAVARGNASNSKASCRCSCKATAHAFAAGPVHQRLRGQGSCALSDLGAGDSQNQRPVGDGNLTVTLETDEARSAIKASCPSTGERLAGSLQGYFQNSEQLPTRLWLHADEQGVSGMLLQNLSTARGRLPRRRCRGRIEDAWASRADHRRYLTKEELAR